MEIYNIYISYIIQDFDVARQIHEHLIKKGIKVFFKIDTLRSGYFAEELASRIASSKVFICLLSEESLKSSWVVNEISFASKLNIPIIPILLDDVKLIEKSPLFSNLSCHKAINISNNENLEESLDYLVESINRILIYDYKNKKCTYYNISHSPSPSPSYFDKVYWKQHLKTHFLKRIFYFIITFFALILLLSYIFFKTDSSSPDHLNEVNSVSFQGNAVGNSSSILFNSFISISIGLGIIGVVYIVKRHTYTVILHNTSVDKDIKILVDGKFVSTLKANNICKIKRRKGKHIIFVHYVDDKEGQNIYQDFDRTNNQKIIPISPNEEKENNSLFHYRCFIAGSTSIVKERNTARAAMSVLYNQFERFNFAISSYTFEDFKNKYCIEGHQYQYDEFIRKKADCTIFLICNQVGAKTIEEYNVAIESYKNTNPRHPAIFVYNSLEDKEDVSEQDASVIAFHKRVTEEFSYWRNYKDLEDLMLKIKEDLASELTDILVMRPMIKNCNSKELN